MAEEIKLVGVFQDNITPQLKKLNTQIKSLTKSFEKFGKKLRPIAKEMGNLAAATERVADGLQKQKKSIDAASRSWSNYKREVGKAGSATRKAFPGASRGAPGAPRGRRGSGGKSGGGGIVGAISGASVGNQISNLVTSAIVKGFQIGTSLLVKPFQFIGSGIAERIEDEMSDVRAAGGLFAISSRMKDGGFVASFAEAETLTKETNRYLAELAGALPGDTQEYIQVSKQISDGIYTMISNDKENAMKLAEKIAAENGRVLKAQGEGGAKAMQEAGKEIVGEMTKLTVLAGMGGRQGAFGLPQLTEQMISMDTVSMGMFRRYAAIFRDPMIKGALERNIEKINAAGKNTAERMEAIRNTLQEVVTPELVRRYQRTTSGVLESLRTTFLNPEVGLLGLGRPLSIMSKKFDEFGNVVMENGKVVEENMAIFDYLRDIFANLFIVLGPLLEAATALFDPFLALGQSLDGIREATMAFQRSFEDARVTFEDVAETLSGDAKTIFSAQIGLRASLAAITKAFYKAGVYGPKEAATIIDALKSPATTMKQLQEMIPKMLDDFLTSDLGGEVGGAIGSVLGTILKSFADILTALFGDVAADNKFVAGFVTAFNESGGQAAIGRIFDLVFDKLGDLITTAITRYPAQTLTLGAVVFGPAILGPIVGAFVAKLLTSVGGMILAKLATMQIGATIAGWLGAVGPAFAALKAAVMALAAPFAILAAKIALIVGLALGVVALIRHADYIISTVVESLKIFWNTMQWLGKGLQEFFYTIMSKLPGWLGGGNQWAEKAEKVRADREKLSAATSASVDKINKNTADSLNRTAKDFERLGNALKGRGLNTNDEVKKPGSNAPSSVPVSVTVPTEANPVPALTQTNVTLDALKAETTAQKAIIDKLKADLEKSKAELAHIKTEIKGTKAEVSSTKTGVVGALNNLSSKFTGVIKTEVVKMPPMTFPMGGGDPRGGGGGPIGMKAAAMGLTLTSHMRPGDPGYHGIGRAWDYSNSTGPTPEMHRFATWLATNYGGNLKELIYTPLGYSIKNGQRVPAFAKDSHYNHVHVAYGMGANSPAFFSSQQDAVKWEKKVAPGNSAIASVTSNSSEFGSANINVQAINISGVNDPKAIANTVATEILFAMKRAENTELDIS